MRVTAMLMFIGLLWGRASAMPPEDIVYETSAREDRGRLHFSVRDASGGPIPARLTFVAPDGSRALFRKQSPARRQLAVRDHVIYTLSGDGVCTVPVGRYTVYASRGLEWSVARAEVEITTGSDRNFEATLVHEIDSSGWVSGDFHLHTLQYSGHGDADLLERVISIVGEGLEFAVATDHNHHTTYDPAIAATGSAEFLTAVTGNEVSTPIGHFNAFPLDPHHAIPDADEVDANALFRDIRSGYNEFDLSPIVQVNHPRWGGIDYFGQVDLDPIDGRSENARCSLDFDSVEILNENAAWGYRDADHPGGVDTGSGRHWALRDWFLLLARGHRITAVGNSDSHTVRGNLAGVPRNFLVSSTDDPSRIGVPEMVDAIRSMAVFTTTGPFVEFTVNGVGMGGMATASAGSVTIDVKVQAASWIDVDRVMVVVNGDVVRTLEVGGERAPLRLVETIEVPVQRDGFVLLLVEGDDPMDPVVPETTRPILPLAITNPVWIDVDGDGISTPLAEVLRGDDLAASPFPGDLGETERCFRLFGLTRSGALEPVRRGLEDASVQVRLAAARTAERVGLAEAMPDLSRVLDSATPDPFLEITVLRALASLDPTRDPRMAVANLERFVARHPTEVVERYAADYLKTLESTVISEWMVLRYFPNPARTTLLAVDYGPENDPDLAREYVGKGGPVRWEKLDCTASGYLDLFRKDAEGARPSDYAIAYAQTQVHCDEPRSVLLAMGSDDGCRVWVGGERVIEDRERHAATPFQHLVRVELAAGWNRILVKVENGTSGFGLYLRLFDELRTSVDPGS